MKTFRSIPTIILAGCVAVTAPCLGQQSTSAAGEYVGASGPIHFKLHLVSAPNGLLSGTVDSPEQNAYGLPLGDIHVTGQSLSFSVPSVRGSWVGFISADGNSLSGTYSQGNAFPLNFARAGAPTSVSAGPSLPNAGPPIASAADCPRNSLANYWDGNSWKSLKQVVALPRERGVSILGALSNPLNPGAGNTTIYRYKGASADIKLGPNPRFCFPLAPNTTAEAVIGQLDVKGDVRQTEMKSYQRHDTKTPFADKKTFDADLDSSKGSSFEATPKKSLPPGQYLITNGIGFYDFTVE